VIGKIVLPKEAEGRVWTLQGGFEHQWIESRGRRISIPEARESAGVVQGISGSPAFKERQKKQRYYQLHCVAGRKLRQEDVVPESINCT